MVLDLDHSQAKLGAAHSHGGAPAGSRSERMTSFDLKDFPVPSGREEEWRFTPVREFSPLFETGHNSEAITMDVSLAPEVKAEVVPADDPRLGQTGAPGDRAAAAGWSAAGQAVVVTIPQGTTASEPTNLSIRALARDAAAVKILIHAETGSKGVVIIDHSGNGIVNETVEIVVDDEAELTVVAVQDWESGESSPDGRLRAGAIHASSHRSIVGENAKLKHVVVTLGGQAVRVTPDVKFTKSNGDAQLLGLYFADAGQYMEHRLFVDHSVRSCKSRVTYKGALQGANAHTVWVGDVFIGAEATETDTYELNRNLVLTKGARADSVPNLEIETGEIAGAGHASATGRFDDQQLFYLMARGIPAAEARRLVVRGFFAELISSIGVAHVEERLMTAIEAELNKTATAELAGKGGQD